MTMERSWPIPLTAHTGRRLLLPQWCVLRGITLALCFAACSSVELPTTEESRHAITLNATRLDSADRAIRAAAAPVPGGADLVLRVQGGALNRMMRALADTRSDDVRLSFLPTRPLVKEEKSILGISYVNTLDIDSGSVLLNLTTLRFDKLEHNRLEAELGIEGHGRIAVSGRHTGIPAGAHPDIDLRLRENIAFDLRGTDTGTIVLRPIPKTLMLKARFTVKLLQWGIPWNEDIPLQIEELVKPLVLPVALRTEIGFPVPSSETQSGAFEFVPHLLSFTNSVVTARGNAFEFRSSIYFLKK